MVMVMMVMVRTFEAFFGIKSLVMNSQSFFYSSCLFVHENQALVQILGHQMVLALHEIRDQLKR